MKEVSATGMIGQVPALIKRFLSLAQPLLPKQSKAAFDINQILFIPNGENEGGDARLITSEDLELPVEPERMLEMASSIIDTLCECLLSYSTMETCDFIYSARLE